MGDTPDRQKTADRPRGLRDRFRRTWIELTGQEQQAVLLVLVLFLLGLAVRWWCGTIGAS